MNKAPIIVGEVLYVDGLEDYIKIDYSSIRKDLCPYCNKFLYPANVHEAYCKNCNIDWMTEMDEVIFKEVRELHERAK